MKKNIKLAIQPGIVKEVSSYAAEGQWVDGNRVRFRFGLPETIGGWVKYALGTTDGTVRAMHGWQALDNTKWLGLGTEKRLYVENGGTFYDVTPLRTSGTYAADPFATTNGSPTVTVTHNSHGLSIHDIIIIAGSSAVGGITPNGEYVVATVPTVNSFTITHASNATSTATGGGAAATYKYLINVGLGSNAAGYGWGSGTWGESTWGTARSSGSIQLALRLWSIDNYGEDLLAAPFQDALFTWDKSGGTTTRATKITQAPQKMNTFVRTKDRFIISLGCSDAGGSTNFDPLQIRWCSQTDNAQWDPTAVGSSAGDYRLGSGKAIIAGEEVRDEILIWTDEDLFLAQPADAPYWFTFAQIGTSCGLVAMKARASVNGMAFWMSDRQFMVYRAGVQPIPCPLRRHVFDDLNYSQADKIFAAVNSVENEIWWFFCSAGSTEVDRYVAYNYTNPDPTKAWHMGNLNRTAWLDKGTGSSFPLAAGTDGKIYVHEYGELADGEEMDDYIESALFDIGDGDAVMFIDRMQPDFNFKSAGTTVRVTLTAQKFQQSSSSVSKSTVIGASTAKWDTRLRGRMVKLRIDGINGRWQMGAPVLRVQADGMR